jgi:long-subunit acyl-CoA synthetase (AMP-forming)
MPSMLLKNLLDGLVACGTALEAYDRTGSCVRRVDGAQLVEATEAYGPLFDREVAGGRKLCALLFRSEETIEFLIATFAALSRGFTVVPLYPNWSAATQREYLEAYGVRTLACGDGFLDRARAWQEGPDAAVCRLIPVSLDCLPPSPARETGGGGGLQFPLAADHPCAWLFTSGTSGDRAKCTEITFENLEAAIENLVQLDFLHPGMTLHSPLSTSHIFAFVVILGFLALKPRRILFSDVQYLARLPEERTGKVDGLILVPIVLHRMRTGFYEKLSGQLDPRTAPPELRRLARLPLALRRWIKSLVRLAEDLLIEREQGKLRGHLGLPVIALVRALFGRVFQKRLGSPGFVVVGGAKPNLQAMALLEVMGVRCLQGWGMTETTGPLCVCRLADRFRGAFGTCGDLFPRCRATIEEGELIVEGPQIARGYVEPDGTVVQFRGRKRTGDRAEFDGRGRLKVLGKTSDRITTDNGLNYNPVPMEEALKAADLARDTLLEEVVVVGDGKPRLGAVLFLRDGVDRGTRVESYVASLVREHNALRPADEQIALWVLSEQSLKDAGGLGPSGKIVRRRIEERFAGMYGEVLV